MNYCACIAIFQCCVDVKEILEMLFITILCRLSNIVLRFAIDIIIYGIHAAQQYSDMAEVRSWVRTPEPPSCKLRFRISYVYTVH